MPPALVFFFKIALAIRGLFWFRTNFRIICSSSVKNAGVTQWNRIENLEMDPQTCSQLIFDKAGKNIQWNKDSLFSKWCWENWTETCRIMNLDHFLTPYTKINAKSMTDINVKTGSHQSPRGENRQRPLWPQPQQLLIWHVSRGKENKGKNELLGPHQNRNILHSKGNNQQK